MAEREIYPVPQGNMNAYKSHTNNPAFNIHAQNRGNRNRHGLWVFILIMGFLAILFPACHEDDTMLPDEEEEVSDSTVFELLSQFPVLPATPYSYSDIDLPPTFGAPGVADQDNTPAGNPVTDAGATLGRVLFYDKHLSANNTIACASCHKQAEGFSDNSPFSTGFEGGLTGRNSMGLSNARFYENGHFFWDERAETLEDQALMPIQDPVEMGMSLEDLVAKLSQVDYYPALFEDAFGSSGITSERISMAISQFVRSMLSYQTEFDDGLALVPPGTNPGIVDFPNYSASENLGKNLFFSQRTNCAACHGSINFVGTEARNNGLELILTDNGLGDVTGDPADNGKFKFNSLRNIALTAPYMHDGRFATLEQVVEHYNSGVQMHPNLHPLLLTPPPGPPAPRRLNLTDVEKQAIVDFLETLTDDALLADIRYSDPFE